MSIFQLGGNSGNIPLAGGWRKRQYDLKIDLNKMSQLNLLKSRIAAFFEKQRGLVSYSTDKSSIDLRPYCTPVEYQYIYFTCTAFAVLGSIEFMHKRWSIFEQYCKTFSHDINKILEIIEGKKKPSKKKDGNEKIKSVIMQKNELNLLLSKLFLYKLANNTVQEEGPFIPFNTQTILDMVQKFGVCSEKYWPYSPAYANPGFFYTPPSAYCFREAEKNQSKNMFVLELDQNDIIKIKNPGEKSMDGIDLKKPLPLNTALNKINEMFKEDPILDDTKPSKKDVVKKIKEMLFNYHIPVVGSFYLYDSTWSTFLTDYTGYMPYPKDGDIALGGHSVMFVGYDDNIEIPPVVPGQKISKGAFLFKNSWSNNWGENGYGYLSYDYFYGRGENDDKKKEVMATDFWSVYTPIPEETIKSFEESWGKKYADILINLPMFNK